MGVGVGEGVGLGLGDGEGLGDGVGPALGGAPTEATEGVPLPPPQAVNAIAAVPISSIVQAEHRTVLVTLTSA